MNKELIDKLRNPESPRPHNVITYYAPVVTLTPNEAKQCLAALEGRGQEQRWTKTQRERCEKFLLANGFEKTAPIDYGVTYEGCGILVDVTESEITLLDDDGDFFTVCARLLCVDWRFVYLPDYIWNV